MVIHVLWHNLNASCGRLEDDTRKLGYFWLRKLMLCRHHTNSMMQIEDSALIIVGSPHLANQSHIPSDSF